MDVDDTVGIVEPEPVLTTTTCAICQEVIEKIDFFTHMETAHPEEHARLGRKTGGPRLFTDKDGNGILKFNSTPPKYVVESCFTDCLKEMAQTLSVTADGGTNKLSPVDSFRAALAIWAAELFNLDSLMKQTQRVTLTSKHKLVFDMIPLWLLRVELLRANLDSEMQESDWVVTGAARESVSILECFHKLMDENVTIKAKKAFVTDFKEQFRANMEVA